jgi:hypothetical protein
VNEAWEIFETEPRELGSALAEVHLRLARCTTACRSSWLRGWRSWSGGCWRGNLSGRAGGDADVLGVEGLAEFEALLDGASR